MRKKGPKPKYANQRGRGSRRPQVKVPSTASGASASLVGPYALALPLLTTSEVNLMCEARLGIWVLF